MFFSIRQFQRDVGVWNDHNFPNKAPHQPLLGVVEECCGELQTIEGFEQGLFDDAVGDTCVYLADYCNQNVIDLEDAVTSFTPKPWDYQEATNGLAFYCGQLCHAHLKMEQKIRGNEQHAVRKIEAVGGIIWHLSRWPSVRWLETATKVFAEVSKRDWIKYPQTGFPVPEPMAEIELDDPEPGFMCQPTADQGTLGER